MSQFMFVPGRWWYMPDCTFMNKTYWIWHCGVGRHTCKTFVFHGPNTQIILFATTAVYVYMYRKKYRVFQCVASTINLEPRTLLEFKEYISYFTSDIVTVDDSLHGNDEAHPLMITTTHGRAVVSQKTKFVGPTWGPPGSCRSQMGPMLAP